MGKITNQELSNDIQIGSLATLNTTTKTNVVSAINEVKSEAGVNQNNISTNTTNIGTLSNLTTTAKSNLVSAINEVKSEAGVTSFNGTTGAITGVSSVNGQTGVVTVQECNPLNSVSAWT